MGCASSQPVVTRNGVVQTQQQLQQIKQQQVMQQQAMQQQVMSVTVPIGAQPGTVLQMNDAYGRLVQVQVPPGMSEGMQFQVQLGGTQQALASYGANWNLEQQQRVQRVQELAQAGGVTIRYGDRRHAPGTWKNGRPVH